MYFQNFATDIPTTWEVNLAKENKIYKGYIITKSEESIKFKQTIQLKKSIQTK